MPPLVRRQPLSQRIKTLLNPYDFLLWLAEEMHESAIDEKLKGWTLPIGVAANFVYMIARANSGNNSRRSRDDVFGDFDGRQGSGWLAFFASFTANSLVVLSLLNALYLFTRTRKYRLFETNVQVPPTTPSARRVKVDSSPASNSPLSYFSSKFAATTAAQRAHPDERADVWELAIWDPRGLHLSFFSLFSPGHVLVYWIFLPTSSQDPRPSVTVVKTILLAALLSAQLLMFKHFFERKASDDRILHREVLNEYDTKFVHPSLNRPVRDVGTQSRESSISAITPGKTRTREVEVYTPTTVINRGWKINPNPSYAAHLGDNVDTRNLYSETPARGGSSGTGRVSGVTPLLSRNSHTLLNSPTPLPNTRNVSSSSRDVGIGPQDPPLSLSPQKQAPVLQPHRQHTHRHYQQQQQQQQQQSSRPSSDGGNLGVYSHAASPLRKTAGRESFGGGARLPSTGGGREGGSPLKRVSTHGAGTSTGLGSGSAAGTGSGSGNLQARLNGLRRENRPF